MKHRSSILCLIIAFLFLACGTTNTNGITEVGNPTTTTTKMTASSATLKAVNYSYLGLADSFGPANLEQTLTLGGATTNFDCSYDIDTKTESCTCSGGGSIEHVFDSGLERAQETLIFNHAVTTTFTGCIVNTCETDVRLDGTSNATVTGSLNLVTHVGSLQVVMATDEDCRGLTHQSADLFGASLTVDFADTSTTYAGNFCIENDDIPFTTLEELRQSVDPDTTCADFEP